MLYSWIGYVAAVAWTCVGYYCWWKVRNDIRMLPFMKKHYPYKQYLYRTDITTLPTGPTLCAFCLGEWVNGERITQIHCGHSAHQQCIMDFEAESGKRECWVRCGDYNQWPDQRREHVHYYGGMKRYIKNKISSLLFAILFAIVEFIKFLCWIILRILAGVAIIPFRCLFIAWMMVYYIGCLFVFVLMYIWDRICSILCTLQGLNCGSGSFDIDQDYITNKEKWYIDYAYSSKSCL